MQWRWQERQQLQQWGRNSAGTRRRSKQYAGHSLQKIRKLELLPHPWRRRLQQSHKPYLLPPWSRTQLAHQPTEHYGRVDIRHAQDDPTIHVGTPTSHPTRNNTTPCTPSHLATLASARQLHRPYGDSDAPANGALPGDLQHWAATRLDPAPCPSGRRDARVFHTLPSAAGAFVPFPLLTVRGERL